MIKKQNLLFLTLFSLILVLGVYYITMPDQLLVSNDLEEKQTEAVVNVTENEYLTALEVELEDKRQERKGALEGILNDSETTTEEKNNAYLELRYLNNLKGQEELIEKKLKNTFNLDSFVEVADKDISVVISESTHDIKLANEIMNSIQEEYDEKMVISVKFQE